MKLKNLNINVVFVSIVAVLCVAGIAFAMTRAPHGDVKSVSVTGECIRKVAKDRTSVTVEIKNLEQSNTAATKKSMDTYQKLSDLVVAMKKQNPKMELQTQSINSNQKYEWDGKEKKNVLVGYESIIRLQVTSDKQEEIGKLLGEVAKYRDVFTGSLSSFTSMELMKSEQEACIVEAAANAREKAQALADGGKTRLGRMTAASFHQSVGGSNYDYRANYEMQSDRMRNKAVAAAAPQIFSSDSDISVTVDAAFELR